MKISNLIFVCLISLIFASCTTAELNSLTFNSRFPTEKVMKLESGMSSDKIVEMFGNPDDVSISMCGKNHGKPWRCTFWEYGEYGSGYASFIFQKIDGKLILNSFDVDR